MKTVVTGASGHVGANLVRELLAADREVRVLVHQDARALEDLPVQQVRGDVCDVDGLCAAFDGAEVVYHLAAIVSITGDRGGLVDAVNVGGTANVVKACRRQGVRRLVHFSSVHALQQTPLDEVLDERRPAAAGPGVLAYDRAKAAGEAVVLAEAGNDFEVVVLNPTAIMGPLDFRGSPTGTLIAKLYQGRLPALVDGGFDWVDVRDVVQGAMAAERLGRSGERYVLSGAWASVGELAALVHECGGARPPRFTSSLGLASVGAPLVEAWSRISGTVPLYTRDSLNVLRHSNRHISRDKAVAELGYAPRALADTVRDTVQWWRREGVA